MYRFAIDNVGDPFSPFLDVGEEVLVEGWEEGMWQSYGRIVVGDGRRVILCFEWLPMSKVEDWRRLGGPRAILGKGF